MNRHQEHIALRSELSQVGLPQDLDNVMGVAHARAKKRAIVRNCFILPMANVLAVFAVFVILVNVSPTVASAMERIPGLQRLAAAVSFSPSLTAMIDHDFVQHIGQEQTENGITARIEYVIVDQRQLNVFYTLDSDIYFSMDAMPTLLDTYEHFGHIESFASAAENNNLRQFTADFTDGMPGRVTFELAVGDLGLPHAGVEEPVQVPQPWDPYAEPEHWTRPETIATFVFDLEFDPTFTEQGEIFELNREFLLDGQRLTINTLEIYPSHMRVNISACESNTAWLTSLQFHFENERAERFEQPGGIISTGSFRENGQVSYRIESAFFAQSESLTMVINEASWLDKDLTLVRVDLVAGTADWLSEGVTLESAERFGENWQLTFSAYSRGEHMMHQLFHMNHFDEHGNEYWRNVISTSSKREFNEETGMYEDVPGVFNEFFTLHNYPYDVVYLSPVCSRFTPMNPPVAVRVK